MIAPEMVDSMRATVISTLGPATAQLRTRTPHRSPTGGTTYTWADAGAARLCSIAPMSADEMELAGRMAARGSVSCRVPWDMDVDPADRITVGGTGSDELDGEWEVTAVLTGSPVVDRLLFLARAS